ncbi:IQ-domain 14 [Striga asiatica]|uniref:IQ-domain 14 n=1 Tax=Striga asiatica TaxID=4170 RepID=A0A5A7QHX4_STRAF|nr:IQ-domain 14 [Striga asiatica]
MLVASSQAETSKGPSSSKIQIGIGNPTTSHEPDTANRGPHITESPLVLGAACLSFGQLPSMPKVSMEKTTIAASPAALTGQDNLPSAPYLCNGQMSQVEDLNGHVTYPDQSKTILAQVSLPGPNLILTQPTKNQISKPHHIASELVSQDDPADLSTPPSDPSSIPLPLHIHRIFRPIRRVHLDCRRIRPVDHISPRGRQIKLGKVNSIVTISDIAAVGPEPIHHQPRFLTSQAKSQLRPDFAIGGPSNRCQGPTSNPQLGPPYSSSGRHPNLSSSQPHLGRPHHLRLHKSLSRWANIIDRPTTEVGPPPSTGLTSRANFVTVTRSRPDPLVEHHRHHHRRNPHGRTTLNKSDLTSPTRQSSKTDHAIADLQISPVGISSRDLLSSDGRFRVLLLHAAARADTFINDLPWDFQFTAEVRPHHISDITNRSLRFAFGAGPTLPFLILRIPAAVFQIKPIVGFGLKTHHRTLSCQDLAMNSRPPQS